ncbi:LysM peptidoglycan-binding domain-containing protein [Geoalkalibacter halelectricus]|uniref:LysM peptidoglycan-binding domain-containing protein n=1 Tax=Geoalkalibacter halelectricus TaxID=2847045 RepID=A0ABY5ZRK0_9BACT|nr:LysM peptidoglycan-binding domain-containing protein [Geoalkalibacter halelectricus]MDO3377026.1 LysM peptidoglycan-binding domain-containing protein [Geoalkalibacter halelectricus]UWZ81248.1 LysM peptidoglycan-binding domain-containing protein [Geoalkalibacter halelectricus]
MVKLCLLLALALFAGGCSLEAFSRSAQESASSAALATGPESSSQVGQQGAAGYSGKDFSGEGLTEEEHGAEPQTSMDLADSVWEPDFNLIEDAETAADLELLEVNPVFLESEGEIRVCLQPAFDFPVVENEQVRYFVDLYSGPARQTFARWLERSGRYIPMMRSIFAEYGLPEDLAYLAMIESGFNSRAYSWAHAVGPWQFIESTGRMYGLENDWWFDERRDPEKATHAAARYLRDLHRQFDGDWYLAVAAYNAGPGRIQGAIRTFGERDFWKISRGQHLQLETRQFVPKLLASLIIIRDLEGHGFTDLEFHEALAYDVATVPSATDLQLVAELSGVSYDEIKALNPELKRWSTPPGRKNHALRLPVGSKDAFVAAYAQVPVAKRVRYHHHRVQAGDTLLKLAGQYQIRVEDIVALNNIRDPRALRIGSDLILPLREGYSPRVLEELADDHARSRRRTYTVRQGDSLWSIARRFDVTERELRVWNNLGWSNLLRPGQVLAVSAPGRATAASSQRSQAPRSQITYTVKPGDTLWDIGRRYQVGTREIKDWNNLKQGHVLRPGDQLTLMVPQAQRG